MPFLPRDYVVPDLVEHEHFRVRPITVHDVVKDYDAVMSSRTRLWELFGEVWGWPAADLSLQTDLIELAWHQKEGELRRSFNFAVLTPDESRLLGCVYIDPPEKAGADADVCYWTRTDRAELEPVLGEFVRDWLASAWPFSTVRYPGRDLSWDEWEALPDV